MKENKTFFEGIGIYRRDLIRQPLSYNEIWFCEGMASGEGNNINEGYGDGLADGTCSSFGNSDKD